jgi:hypothetical protein
MDKFDQEELKTALKSENIPLKDDAIRRLDGALRAVAKRYRARKVTRAQDLSGQLAILQATKTSLVDLLDTELLLYAFEAETASIIKRLSVAVQHASDFLENKRDQRRVRRDDTETTLFMDLRDVYVGLTGKTGISEDGPLHRFAKACAKLIDASIILPQTQSLRKALKRRAKRPHVFGNRKVINNGVHSLERRHGVPAQLDEGK